MHGWLHFHTIWSPKKENGLLCMREAEVIKQQRLSHLKTKADANIQISFTTLCPNVIFCLSLLFFQWLLVSWGWGWGFFSVFFGWLVFFGVLLFASFGWLVRFWGSFQTVLIISKVVLPCFFLLLLFVCLIGFFF